MTSEVQNSLRPSSQKPFLIEIRQERLKRNGTFVPAASLKLTEELRTSGLLHALPPDELKSLVYLLTFLSPEGHCSVSLPILTSAMRVSPSLVKQRMHRLAGFRFRDNPLITEIAHESGLCTYSLHPRLVAYEHLTISEPHARAPLPGAASRRVIAHSRRTYARPREEVERIVAAQMGYDSEETAEQRKLRTRLENVGLSGEQAKDVLATYEPDAIAQQLDWLPFRNAKNPAGYLLAAIEGGYQEPRIIRERRFVLEEKYGGDKVPEELRVGADEDEDIPERDDDLPEEDDRAGSEDLSHTAEGSPPETVDGLKVGAGEISLSPDTAAKNQ